jgi:para-aminobenzoate synthetase component 1
MTISNTLSLEKKKQFPDSFCSKKFPFLKEIPKAFHQRSLTWREPVDLAQRLHLNNPFVFLDTPSSQSASQRSFIAWDPWLWIRGRKNRLEWREGRSWRSLECKDPYEEFHQIFKTIQNTHRFPKSVGAFGTLSYELGEFFEQLPEAEGSQERIYFEFIFPRQVLTFEPLTRQVEYWRAGNLKGLGPFPLKGTGRRSSSRRFSITGLTAQFTPPAFYQIVEQAKEYIRAGDIYQANLSQDFSFRFRGDAFSLYKKLRDINPSPFSSFIRLGERTLLSSSPELLLRKNGTTCLTRPIAGTRPRGKSEKEERGYSRALLLSPKEKAEHLMLLDLERNDLGRVSEFGTVNVEEQMVLERYSHVIHIVSQVAGKMRLGLDAFDLIRALFPGGTITGCPKIRSMEIIHELENKPRELYTGSLGFLGFSGEAVFNIIIRTIVLEGRRGSLRVGAGIVADSDPRREYRETIQKGRALFKALGIPLTAL